MILQKCSLSFLFAFTFPLFLHGMPFGGIELPTPNADVSCVVRELSASEVQALFFNEQVADFQRTEMHYSDFAAANLSANGQGKFATAGMHSLPAVTAEHISMRDLHNVYKPVAVEIQNKSNKAIYVSRDNYIKAYARAIIFAEKLASLYPDFNAKRLKFKIMGIAFAVFSGISFVGSLLAFGKGAPVAGLGALLLTGASVFGVVAGFRISGMAQLLKNKVAKLRSLAPVLRDSLGVLRQLNQSSWYEIPAGATFSDILILNASSLQHSNALFGAKKLEPELDFMCEK